MSQRLKVLISAYACEPNKGSEPEVGWQWALQMARFHDVTVLTRSNNRRAIDEGLAKLDRNQSCPKFVYHDRHSLLLNMKRRARATKLYYLLWQKSARKVVHQLHLAHQFDLMHHVTFAGYRYPTAIWGHGVPTIWGPVGGIESIPAVLLPWRHPASLFTESFRNLTNVVQATPYYVLPRRAAASTLILASTREMQQTFSRLGFAAELMPTIGLKLADMAYTPRPSSQGPLKLLFVGNIITLKGIDLALEALKLSQTTAEFTLVGSGNFLNAARQQVRNLGLETRVSFKGRLPREQVLRMYSQYDVFVFPSLHDTGGYAVIEAMSNELPVICLDCGGPAIAVGPDCGIKVPLGNRAEVINHLAQAFQTYDQDRALREKHGKTARQVILEKYEWDRKGVEMKACYEEAVTRFAARNSGSRKGYSGIGGVANLLSSVFSFRGLVVALLGLFLIGAFGFISIGRLKTQARTIVTGTLPGLTYAGEANLTLAQAFNRTLLLLLAESSEQKARLRNEIEMFSLKTTVHLGAYEHQISCSDDRACFDELVHRREDYLQIRKRVMVVLDENQRAAAVAICNQQLLPAYQGYKEAATKLFEYNIQQGEAHGRNIMNYCTATQFIVAAVGVIIFLLGFLIGISR